MTRIAILGAGGWGTALAIVLSRSRKPHEISLWVHNAGLAEAIRRDRENKTYLPGSKLSESVRVHPQLEAALAGAQVILGAMPSAHARAVYASALPFVAANASFVSASKGLEPSTHLRISEVIAQVVSPKFVPRIAVISGPSFAVEAARGEPTAVVLASRDAALATELQEEFAGPNFRLYTNDDVLGVELAGAMKNVMAIAAGACQGLGLGSNAVAALITRGLAEMARLELKQREFSPFEIHAARHILVGKFLHRFYGLTGTHSRGGAAIDCGGRVHVVAANHHRTIDVAHLAGHAVPRQPEGISTESVSFNNLGTGL